MDGTAQFVLIAKRILRELSALSETVRTGFLGVQKQISSIRDQQEAADQHRQQNEQRPQTLNAELQVPEEVQRQKRTSDNRQFGIQVALAIVTFFAFVAAAIYAGIAARQLTQMKIATEKAGISADAARAEAETARKSFEIERRRAEETEEARVDNISGARYGSHLFKFAFHNNGKVSAYNVRISLEVWLSVLPMNEERLFLGRFDTYKDELHANNGSGDIAFYRIEKDVIYAKLTSEEWERIADTKEAILQKGTIEFDNGFGDIRKDDVCMVEVYIRAPNDRLNPVQERGTRCDTLQSFMRDWLPIWKAESQQNSYRH